MKHALCELFGWLCEHSPETYPPVHAAPEIAGTMIGLLLVLLVGALLIFAEVDSRPR
jgi:hypothetical protein